MDLFERSKERWKEKYLFDMETRSNSGQDYGRKMADGLEHDELTGDVVLDLVVAQIPKLEVMEFELNAELSHGKKREPIKLFSRLDTANRDLSAFKEYKTGLEPWTQTKVDNSGQITFYATGAYLKTGKLTEDIELVYVPTERSLDGRIRATGDMTRFRTHRRLDQVLNMMVRVKRAWEGMEKLTHETLL